MILDYIRFSLKILNKHKFYAFISVFGLAVGISCCILISMFVSHELSYDNFHPDKDRIFRLTTVGNGFTTGLTNYDVGPALRKDNSDIESFCRYLTLGDLAEVKYNDKLFNEADIIVGDDIFFEFFGFELIPNSSKNLLQMPNTVILTQSLSQKYFGGKNPINDSIIINKKSYLITGIAKDNPGNSDIQFSAIISLNGLSQKKQTEYYKDLFRVVCFTYIKFSDGFSQSSIQQKLNKYSENYVKPWGLQNDTKQVDYFQAKPIQDVHFDNNNEFDTPKGNLIYVYIFSSIALFVLLIACINYINLSLSQATTRSKEIGIRKTLGSDHIDIKLQFLTETILISILAYFIGLIFVEILIPIFNELTSKSFEFRTLFNIYSILYSILFILVISTLSGVYPAFVLSSYKPIEVLKGKVKGKSNIGFIRKGLITVQFVFSISMIICSLIVFQQIEYMKNKDLGFKKDSILVYRVPSRDSTFVGKLPYIQRRFNDNPIVEKTAFSSTIPGEGLGDLMFRVEKNNGMEDAQLKLMTCDENYLQLVKVNFIEGRNFQSVHDTALRKEFIINKSAAEELGWSDNAIGKRLQWGLLPEGKAEHDGVVIGVVEDFHSHTLHTKIAPMVIQYVNRKKYFSVSLKKDTDPHEIQGLNEIFKSELGDQIMEVFSLDKNFNSQYRSEERMLKVFNYFTILSIILCTLGLFALTSFIIKQKTKEIGIRKILGASLNNIILILAKDFLILLVIGFSIACVPTYYFITTWLGSFSYHVEIGILPFISAAGITFIIIVTVITYNTIKTDNLNPIDALKSE